MKVPTAQPQMVSMIIAAIEENGGSASIAEIAEYLMGADPGREADENLKDAIRARLQERSRGYRTFLDEGDFFRVTRRGGVNVWSLKSTDDPTSPPESRRGSDDEVPAAEEGSRLLAPDEADQKPFDPKDMVDAREIIVRQIRARRGQQAFRNALLEAFERRCAITGCTVVDVLEAAHITPYLGPDTNDIGNGLLLRADVHTLFDCGLLGVHPLTLEVLVHPSLRGSDYGKLHGQQIRQPLLRHGKISKHALGQHLDWCGFGDANQ